VGVFVPALGGFALLQSRLLVEIVDDEGRALPPGQRGEITVTGGFNPWLPLLRYRTGDFAQMAATPHGLVLRELEGRAPVRFRSASGQWLNNIEATRALAAFALTRFSLHQRADASFVLKVDAAEPLATLAPGLDSALKALLGDGIQLHIEPLPVGDKVRQYTSDLCP
jgi:phenylacetate-CoA ligase